MIRNPYITTKKQQLLLPPQQQQLQQQQQQHGNDASLLSITDRTTSSLLSSSSVATQLPIRQQEQRVPVPTASHVNTGITSHSRNEIHFSSSLIKTTTTTTTNATTAFLPSTSVHVPITSTNLEHQRTSTTTGTPVHQQHVQQQQQQPYSSNFKRPSSASSSASASASASSFMSKRFTSIKQSPYSMSQPQQEHQPSYSQSPHYNQQQRQQEPSQNSSSPIIDLMTEQPSPPPKQQQQIQRRPTSSSSSSSSSQSSQQQLPQKQQQQQQQQQSIADSCTTNIAAIMSSSNHNTVSYSSSTATTTISRSSTANNTKEQEIVNRYCITLPPEIRFHVTDPIVQPIQDQYRTELIKHAALSEPLQNGWNLYSHQKRAILVSLLMRRQILALDMGLGKTLIGCCFARAFVRTIPTIQVLIICPVSLKQEWERTASTIVGLPIRGGGRTSSKSNNNVEEDEPNDDDEDDDDDDVSHPKPRSRKRAKKSKSENDDTTSNSINSKNDYGVVSIVSWAKVPSSAEAFLGPRHCNDKYIVIADEAHSMQSMTSARTRDALQLMLHTNCIGVLLLTGTPMKNGKPANLFPLLKAVKHPFGNHQRAYEAHFCGGRDMSNGFANRPMWVATGAANLDQLRVLTKSHMLHMTKDDVLKELPKQTRVKKTVFVSSRSEMRHNDAMRKLSMIYENKNDPFQQDAILGAVQSVRLVDSFAKVAATVEMAREILRKEAAVVIFTSFVDVAKLVHQKLIDYGWTGELLTGETPAKKRQGMVDKFQNGLSPVFICTFGAGGVGLTLTAACTVILLDRPWTPGDVHQAEDRVRRIGQTKPVTSIWMSAFELDKQIDEMIESKSQTSSTVLSECNTGSNNTNAVPKLSILKMVHNFLSSNHQSSATASSSSSSLSSGSGGLKQATLQEYGHGTSRAY